MRSFMTTSTTLQGIPSELGRCTFIAVLAHSTHRHRNAQPRLVVQVDQNFLLRVVHACMFDHVDEYLFPRVAVDEFED